MNENTKTEKVALTPTKNISFSLLSSIARKAFKIQYPSAVQFVFDVDLITGLDDSELDELCNEARINMTTKDDYHKLTKQKFFSAGSLYEKLTLGLDDKVYIHGDLRKPENKKEALDFVKNSKFGDIIISKSQHLKISKLIKQMKDENPSLYILGEIITFDELSNGNNPGLIKKESCEMRLESGLKLKARLDGRYVNQAGLSSIVDIKTGWKDAGGTIRHQLAREGYDYQVALASYIMKQASHKMSNVNYIMYQNTADPIVNLIEFPFTNLIVSELAVMIKRIESSILRNIDLVA